MYFSSGCSLCLQYLYNTLAGEPAFGGLTCYGTMYALSYHVLCCTVRVVELSSDCEQ